MRFIGFWLKLYIYIKMICFHQQYLQMDLVIKPVLFSIAEEEAELEKLPTTSQALFMVYHQLYAINIVQIPKDPSQVFRECAILVEDKIKMEDIIAQKFAQDYQAIKSKYQKQCIKNASKQALPKPRMLSKEQISARIKEKMKQSEIKQIENKQEQFAQTVRTIKTQKQLNTADSNKSIPDILETLQMIDEQRTSIKFQIYTEQSSKMKQLYKDWANLHTKMKEALQIYVTKIGNGKSLQQIYSQFQKLRVSKRKIDGIGERQLFIKLDLYLQSLFSDERQIIIFKKSQQKTSFRTDTANNVKRKLAYK